MKKLIILIVAFGITSVFAQNSSQCSHCNMGIKSELFKASAKQNNELIEFDAIECMVNYLRINNKNKFDELTVTNHNSGESISAEQAFYVESKGVPSPMGAFLSAYKTLVEAEEVKEQKEGKIYNWESLVEGFNNSEIGNNGFTHHFHNRPDAHAPIGVMGDHLHQKGGLMVSVRYMHMNMDGNRAGVDNISNNDIFNNFMVAPQSMKMDMYMLGLMYAPTDKLTLMVMQNFSQKSMELTTMMPMMGGMNGMGGMMMQPEEVDFSTQTKGVGDMAFSALYGLFADEKNSLHINTKVNVPLGSVKEKGNTPMASNVKLPYAMQLGTGTFDYGIGATFKQTLVKLSFGTQYMATLRSNKNTENYRFGNLHELNVWGSYLLNKNMSLSARVIGSYEESLTGVDKELNPMMVTTANPNNYGSEKAKTFFGLNFLLPNSEQLSKFKLGIEAGVPIYQNYKGIQMNESVSVLVGLKYSVL